MNFLVIPIYEMMDVHETYCGHHFTNYVNQVVKRYALDSYRAACQL